MTQQPPGGRPPGPAYPPPPQGGAYGAPPPQGGAYGAPPPNAYGAPPGGAYAAPDPYAAERALGEWAAARGYALNTSPDLNWYLGWYPLSYFPKVHRIGREVRATFGEASVWVAELFEQDTVKQATGEDRHLTTFLTSPRLVARASVRSRQGGGMVSEISSGLDSLFGKRPAAGSVLGDPTLEGLFDITTPSRDEGNHALPMPLRQLLVQSNWRGILEVRAGGLVMDAYEKRPFEPAALDALLQVVGQTYRAAAGG